MSVICGFLSFSNDESPLDMGNRMISQLDNIPADKVGCWHNENIYLSCHHQYITPEDINETLPYYDSEAGIVITADAIIDNREELFDIFNIYGNDRKWFTDSQLILRAYKKWGEDCSKHLLGDYTYVIYEVETKKLVCSREHTGRSTLYYTMKDGYFAFCTIMKPLVYIDREKGLNEQWIADFLSIPSVVNELDTSMTVYEAVRQLNPAHTLTLYNKKVKISKFWNPFDKPKVRYKTDEEYDEAFREVITEAIRCKLRSTGNIGILLSGGFDSGTVGCIAAGLLQNEGKRLKSYTSVPMEGYIERLGRNAVSDESPYVKEIAGMYVNIDSAFCPSEGQNSFNGVGKYLDIIEHPYKVVENMFWLVDIYEKAKSDGCKVLLNGQYGNITISYGDFYDYFNTLLVTGRLTKLIHEIQMYSRNYRIGRKRILKTLLTGFFPLLNKWMGSNDVKDRFARTFPLINPAFGELYNVNARLDELKYLDKDYKSFTVAQFQKYAFKHPLLSQIAGFEKKMDVNYNLVTRDPTKDKRLIEFCFSLPEDQYIRNGRDKVLLRRAMKGIIPDMIRLNYTKKGVQAADWIQRLIPLWDEITDSVKECMKDERIEKYVNTQGVLDFIEETPELKLNVNFVDLRQTIAAYIFARFISQAEKDADKGFV